MPNPSAVQVPVEPNIAERAKHIYNETLRGKLEPDSDGKFLLIHPDTGDYEIDDDQMAAVLRSMKRHPDGRWFMLRIGYPAAAFFGGVRRSPQ